MGRITERERYLIKNALAFAAGTLLKELEPSAEVDEKFFDFIVGFAEVEFPNFCECQDISGIEEEDY